MKNIDDFVAILWCININVDLNISWQSVKQI